LLSPGRRNFSLKSARIPAKKLFASGPKSLAAGHIANFQTSPRACLKIVNMPNRRVFCPLDGAIFPCNPPGFLRKNCLPAAQNPSLLDTSPIFKQALVFWIKDSGISAARFSLQRKLCLHLRSGWRFAAATAKGRE
ncbi:hypothetical protein, partial [uncultured Intestinimonas sp.]|uniref:hypothetical protein n=1 Tax=uncultured Intestinimonas sp. TaxID=1689265 RepID=UPI0025DCFC1C